MKFTDENGKVWETDVFNSSRNGISIRPVKEKSDMQVWLDEHYPHTPYPEGDPVSRAARIREREAAVSAFVKLLEVAYQPNCIQYAAPRLETYTSLAALEEFVNGKRHT